MVSVVIKKMKKNKKRVLISIIATLIILISICLLMYFFLETKGNNSLTLEENKWIDANKQEIIDIALINDIPVLSYDGDGLVYNYLEYITNEKSLKFNVIPYKMDNEIEYNYKMDIVSNPSKNDIILLKDNLVFISNNNKQYINSNDINNLKIGVLSSDKAMLTEYFKNQANQFVEYTNYNELKKSLVESVTNIKSNVTPKVDGIVVPKTIMGKEIIENNYIISFEMNDLVKYFVLKTNGEKEFNSILKKEFNIWKEENYKESFNKNLLANYFKFKNISDIEQKKLQSKSYVYGFVDYGIYNILDNNKIFGLNEVILKEFNDFSKLSISYTKYNSISKLIKEFNKNKVDFMLNLTDTKNYEVKTYNTIGVFNKELVIISGISNKDVIDNIYSLNKKTVLTIKDSYLEKYLMENNVKVKSYNNFTDLAEDFSNKDIAIVDLENYNYYKSSKFKNCKINYLFDIDEQYNYIINNNKNNLVFKDLFEFYLNYNSINKIKTINYENIGYENSNLIYILIIVLLILFIYVFIDFSNHIKFMFKSIKKRKKTNLTKEEKIKYIDQLTSLKNRAYLNSRIESWDESEVYPQAIIIIDLNNISYINDNYGREEGDKVITEAANILIQHQMQNSEIIRTDGNEFLIYLVGYSEKQIISYLRKLNKEFKSLEHGFGAASGYSIITDAIKTVDDAVNEATLAMKENKEDIDY